MRQYQYQQHRREHTFSRYLTPDSLEPTALVTAQRPRPSYDFFGGVQTATDGVGRAKQAARQHTSSFLRRLVLEPSKERIKKKLAENAASGGKPRTFLDFVILGSVQWLARELGVQDELYDEAMAALEEEEKEEMRIEEMEKAEAQMRRAKRRVCEMTGTTPGISEMGALSHYEMEYTGAANPMHHGPARQLSEQKEYYEVHDDGHYYTSGHDYQDYSGYQQYHESQYHSYPTSTAHRQEARRPSNPAAAAAHATTPASYRPVRQEVAGEDAARDYLRRQKAHAAHPEQMHLMPQRPVPPNGHSGSRGDARANVHDNGRGHGNHNTNTHGNHDINRSGNPIPRRDGHTSRRGNRRGGSGETRYRGVAHRGGGLLSPITEVPERGSSLGFQEQHRHQTQSNDYPEPARGIDTQAPFASNWDSGFFKAMCSYTATFPEQLYSYFY